MEPEYPRRLGSVIGGAEVVLAVDQQEMTQRTVRDLQLLGPGGKIGEKLHFLAAELKVCLACFDLKCDLLVLVLGSGTYFSRVSMASAKNTPTATPRPYIVPAATIAASSEAPGPRRCRMYW